MESSALHMIKMRMTRISKSMDRTPLARPNRSARVSARSWQRSRERSVADDAIVVSRGRVRLLWRRCLGLRRGRGCGLRRRCFGALRSFRFTALLARLPFRVFGGQERPRIAGERGRILETVASLDRADRDDVARQTNGIALIGRRQIVGYLNWRRRARSRVARLRLTRQRFIARAARDRREPDDHAPGATEVHATRPQRARLRPSSPRAQSRDTGAQAELAG